MASALACSVMLTTPSFASGILMIDPPLGGIMHPPFIVHPPHHPVSPTRPPLLEGHVSYGLHLQSQNVKVTVTDQVARTNIKQVFSNDTDRNLAGTYLFPLPADTTFSSFSLHIDGKPVEGQILAAEDARQQYEEIVRKMIDPGLLEYADYKTVRARIFPIPAHGTKTVELEYTQLLKAEDGLVKYRFPLKTEGETAAADEIKVEMAVSSKTGVRSIWSPSHSVSVSRDGDHNAKISLFEKDTLPDKDFLLYYSVSDKAMSANLLTHKNPDEDGFFLLTLNPPQMPEKVVSKDIVLVADTSGSMSGEKIEQNKKALKYVINALSPDDRFGIVQFNTDVEAYRTDLMPATAANKKTAESFINDLEARGGTNISDALQMGCKMLSGDSARPAYLVLMTDGEPTVGETDISKILKSVAPKRDVRIFDFGVGFDVNTMFLDKLAAEHHGTTEYVEPKDNLETAVAAFYQKIKSPVLTDAHIAINGVETKDVYPREVKDIFAGTQVMLLGKYKNTGKCTVNLTGKVQGVAKAYSFNLNFDPNQPGNTYLPRLWAMRRIGHLTDVAKENHNNKEVVDEIVALSKKYGIITEYTSFLVTDPSENGRLANFSRRDATPLNRPVNVRGRLMTGSAGGAGGLAPIAMAAPMSAPMITEDARSYTASAGHMRYERKGQAQNAVAMDALDFAKDSEVGEKAVVRAKKMNDFKTASTVAFTPASDGIAAVIKTVDDKTFYLRDGVWVEGGIEDRDAKSFKEVVFGSTQYFDLIHKNPEIRKYLTIGQQIQINFKGTLYRITAG
jgi:Ca-activated chloride channel family protein